MIDDLNLAVATCKQFNETEIVVSQRLFFEIVDKVTASGQGHIRVNVPNQSEKYRYKHTVLWQSITFMTLSQELVGVAHSSAG